MDVVLSGGNHGGEVVVWPEGQELLTLEDGSSYRRVGDTDQAVFVG